MKRRAFTIVELLVVVAIIVTLMAILLPNLAAALERARQATCAANLRSIGQSIKVYSSGNRGHWPSVYARDDDSATWGETGWGPENTEISDFQEDVDAENLDTFTCNLSNWWMLIRKGMSSPGVFICPSADQEEDETIDDVEAVWSFRDLNNVSYSYQNQLGKGTTDSADSELVAAADMNPMREDMELEESTRNEDKDKDRWQLNSPNHDFDGQNCLYADGHVRFEQTPYVGIGNNNIWTRDEYNRDEDPSWPAAGSEDGGDYSDKTSQKGNKKDSYLVP
ncbi:MAG: prepilin-type N-terminal cleavage/methylation domain-containing protein [Anaerolineaceae bacterium]|nr:prepilin-type N-terminal cleavage/methylation domain-containing protein [Anaerolineaceae bacterium]